jgi:hypothetical protein
MPRCTAFRSGRARVGLPVRGTGDLGLGGSLAAVGRRGRRPLGGHLTLIGTVFP